MKKNFENTYAIFIFYIFFFLFIIISFHILKNRFYKQYYITQATITNEEQITMILDNKTLNHLNKNKTIYVEGRKKHIHIQKVTRDLIVKNKKRYHQVTVRVKLNANNQLLDTITVTIYKKKRALLTIFEACWKGEKNAETRP